MPTMIDTPVRSDHDTHAFPDDQPQVRVARVGFWPRLVQYVRRYYVQTSSRTRSSAHRAQRQREAPLACGVPEPRTLVLLGFWGLHRG